VKVALVEGGPAVNTRTDFNTHALPFDFPNRHIPISKPGQPVFGSERARGVGGKTMLWNAVALRLSHRDFKGYTIDGAGADWPIDYPDMAPYYDRIEREVGVCGNRDGLEDLPDGIYMEPPPLKLGDLLLQRGGKELGIPIIHTRKATLTRATQARPACHYCGNAWQAATSRQNTTPLTSTWPRP
jgi:choline dehydrogenase-like flavoprotein